MKTSGLISCKGLTSERLAAIKHLAIICNHHDQIRLKLNWDALEMRNRKETNDWLYYQDGQLIGILGIYYFTMSEAEISGMVHPDYRRKGVFQSLVDQAKTACVQRGFPRMVFMNLEFDRAQTNEMIIPVRTDIYLREANDSHDDLKTIISIQVYVMDLSSAAK